MSSSRERSSSVGRVAVGLGALAVLLVLVLGVPVLLVVGVANPWPGAGRIEMADTGSIALGAVAALAWIVWARFTLAVLLEIPEQWRVMRAPWRRPHGAVPLVAPPTRNRAGIGMIAARLVAAVLVLVPIALRAAPTGAAPPLLVRAAPVAVAEPTVSSPAPTAPPAAVTPPPPSPVGPTVVVAEGDTLRGLARRHLGAAERWREIFDLNRDRLQTEGGRLTTPSMIRPGWTLLLPVDATRSSPGPVAEAPPWPSVGVPGAPAPVVDPAIVTVAAGDSLWDLTRQRLRSADRIDDDPHVVVELERVVAANPTVRDDPDLIHPGERIVFPPIAVAPAASVLAAPSPSNAPPPVAAPLEVDVVPAPVFAPPPSPSTTVATGSTSPITAPDGPGDEATAVLADAPTGTTPAETAVIDPSVALPPDGGGGGDEVGATPPAPGPIGLGEAALLSTGALALLAARRRRRLRAAEPRARLPVPPPEQVETERRLRTVDAHERLIRVDIAVRAAAATLVGGIAQPAVICVGADGAVELTLTADATLPAPWEPSNGRWVLPGRVPIERLAETARRVGAPCVALTQLGVDADEREVLVDLEALGVLAVHGPETAVESVVRGVTATLASSIFAEPANLIGVGLDELVFLDHRLAHHVDGVEAAVELATTLVGTTGTTTGARRSTFVLRARHTSGEAWEPAVIVVGPEFAHEVTTELMHAISRRRGGLALVVGGDAPDGGWSLVADGPAWRLDPLGLRLTPVGLTEEELVAVYEVLHAAGTPLAPCPPAGDDEIAVGSSEPPWSLLVRLLGEVDVVDTAGRPVRFERSKTLELIAWLSEHRDRSTRAGARSALWELDVRDATFANVVSEARRALARHVPPPQGEEWLERTLSERLPLHELVVTDADLVRWRLAHARLAPPHEAIEILRPAVELIRGVPFAGTGYLWPDPEGITSNLVLLATTAATELAGHHLSVGDVDGVFWATGRGLQVLPAHEELIGLRMRAHHRAGDLAGVRQEWEAYERVLDADAWGDGEAAPKLVALRRELLSPASAER